jgi:predicted kinase
MGNRRTRRNIKSHVSNLTPFSYSNTRKVKKEYSIINSDKTIPDTIPEDIQEQIDRNNQLIIEAYNQRIETRPKLKLPKRPSPKYSEGFIRRMSEPLF